MDTDYIVDNKMDTFDKDMNEYLDNADIVIISCGHNKYLSYNYEKHNTIKVLFDCWNLLYKKYKYNSSFEYMGIGE